MLTALATVKAIAGFSLIIQEYCGLVLSVVRCCTYLAFPHSSLSVSPSKLINESFVPGVGLMAWSPLAMGLVSGKIDDGGLPVLSRSTFRVRVSKQDSYLL